MPDPLLLLLPAEGNGRGDCIFWILGMDAALILVIFLGVESNTAHLTDKYAPHLLGSTCPIINNCTLRHILQLILIRRSSCILGIFGGFYG